MYGISPTANHLDRVQTLIAAGYKAPQPWVDLAARFNSASLDPALDPEATATARYARAIVAGSKADLTALRAMALAEIAATTVHEATLQNYTSALAGAELVKLYQPVAQETYAAVAKDWDEAGQRLLDLTTIVDPETLADRIVSADETIRRAWSEAMFAASRLADLEPVLIAAAQLAGAEANRLEATAPLIASTQAVHRRRFWEAWNADGNRCGKYSALLAVGAILTAHPAPWTCPEYGLPPAVEEKWERVAQGHRRIMVDPCDIEFEETLKAKRVKA